MPGTARYLASRSIGGVSITYLDLHPIYTLPNETLTRRAIEQPTCSAKCNFSLYLHSTCTFLHTQSHTGNKSFVYTPKAICATIFLFLFFHGSVGGIIIRWSPHKHIRFRPSPPQDTCLSNQRLRVCSYLYGRRRHIGEKHGAAVRRCKLIEL